MAEEKQQDSFEMTTTAQVERTYLVTAANEEQAKKRLRSYLNDPEMIAPGLVVVQTEKQTDTTTQQIKDVKKVARPRAVRDAEAAAS